MCAVKMIKHNEKFCKGLKKVLLVGEMNGLGRSWDKLWDAALPLWLMSLF